MQALSLVLVAATYDGGMQTGRPSKRPRAPFGQRVYAARQVAGLSQAQVAAKLGLTQSGYSSWERDAVALRPDQIAQLARILKVSAEALLGQSETGIGRKSGGPIGKVRQIFERVSRLPRHQQSKVVEFVEAFVERQSRP
jgi:transcriptional regulator with XRE-family HTH domain